jgi:hypothetical protein
MVKMFNCLNSEKLKVASETKKFFNHNGLMVNMDEIK